MSAPSETRVPLSRVEAEEVLRYWLAAVQQEEALMSRPKARAPARGSSVPRLDTPASGQEYFKLPLDQAAQLIAAGEQVLLHKPFDAELRAFFESWLSNQYRRGDQERAVSHLLTFPVVHLARGELSGLLRCPLELAFGQEHGPLFVVPSRTQRRKAEYPPPPNEARLLLAEQPEQRWPFFVDTRLLQQQLGVVRERIDEAFERLRATPAPDARCMLEVICELLESELADSESPKQDGVAELIARIHKASVALLARNASRARVYPVALVLDSARSKASYYLQRDLSKLIEEPDNARWELDSPLGAYLTGDAPELGISVQRGLFRAPALSPSQRYAAERCTGSRFTAVQGPPGTGKTTLILHLAAATLIKQVDALLDTSRMGDALMLVTSTNNRAVDNVIDGLSDSSSEALPLALRVGSQQVCEHLLLPQLEQVRAQLEAAAKEPLSLRQAALQSALAAYAQTRAQLDDVLAPRAAAWAARSERAQLSDQLGRLRKELSHSPQARVPLQHAARVRDALEKIAPRLAQLAALADTRASLPALQALDREQRRMGKTLIPRLEEALIEAGIVETLGLPPLLPPSSDPAVLMDTWSDAIAAAQSMVAGLQVELSAHVNTEIRRERARVLQQKLERLPEHVQAPEYDEAHDELQRALFDAALRVRERWAAAEAEALSTSLLSAVNAVRNDRSLRRLWKEGSREYKLLRQLFGVWGCTLLSLGNCLPADTGAVELLVIDEAGQCHPAYAVSALMRAQRALIIGDVHQLEPVIEIEPDDDERVIKACRLKLSRAALAPYRVHSQAFSSVQSLADRAVSERPSLTEHFRCQPEIIRISDLLCRYELRVLTPREGPSQPLPFLPEPVSLVDVAGEQERLGGSWYNREELEQCIALLDSLLQHGIAPGEIAVITPYRGQLEQLRRRSSQAGFALDRSLELADMEDALPARSQAQGIALGTVHRFQGGERSIVIFSSVVTRRGSLGFVDDRANLLNVAVSRARHRLIVLGNASVLAQGQRTRLLTESSSRLAPDAFRRQLGLLTAAGLPHLT